MRLCLIALPLLAASCSSADDHGASASASAAGTPPSSTAKPPATSSAASATSSASTAASSASAALLAPMRDADSELKAIDPFNETAADSPQRLQTAMKLCGEPTSISPWGEPSDAPWGKEVPEEKPVPTKPSAVSRCAAESHAKLYLRSATLLADSKSPESQRTAELHGYYALALDPKARLPAGVNAATDKLRKSTPRLPAADVRVDAVTSSDERAKKGVEAAAAALLPTLRLCHASGLRNNPNLQGKLSMQALVEPDGRLSDIKTFGSLPDASVAKCATEFAARSKLSPPSTARMKIGFVFMFAPGK